MKVDIWTNSGNGAIIAVVEQSPTAGSSKMGEHEICERFPLMEKESKGIQATKTSQKQTWRNDSEWGKIV